MPKRVIDGEGLWRSKKLKKVPAQYRAEYANLLPIAAANGSFECDPDSIWADVYAFNRPEVTPEMVVQILDELEKAELLRRWTEVGKVWGYWEGICKAGRLPTSHLDRYKNLPPVPPRAEIQSGTVPDNPGESEKLPLGIGIGTGLGFVSGLGEGDENQPPPSLQNEEHGHGDEMKAKKEIPHICKHKLGIGAETYANVWEQVAYLEREHGSSAVIRAFEDWCEGKRLDVTSKPVSKFLEQADGILSGVLTSGGASVVLASPEVVGLVDDLVELSDGSVRFNTQQQQQVAILAKEYSPEEVVSSFRTFFADLKDDFELKMAAKNFVETAGQMIRMARRKKVKQDQITTNLAAQEVEKRREVDAELERVRLEEAEEADLMEDLLPVE